MCAGHAARLSRHRAAIRTIEPTCSAVYSPPPAIAIQRELSAWAMPRCSAARFEFPGRSHAIDVCGAMTPWLDYEIQLESFGNASSPAPHLMRNSSRHSGDFSRLSIRDGMFWKMDSMWSVKLTSLKKLWLRVIDFSTPLT